MVSMLMSVVGKDGVTNCSEDCQKDKTTCIRKMCEALVSRKPDVFSEGSRVFTMVVTDIEEYDPKQIRNLLNQ